MAGDPGDSGPADESGTDAPSEPAGGTAGWQKVMWVVGVLVLLGMVVLLVVGDHGPARHAPQDAPQQDADADAPDGHDPSQFDH